MREFLNVTINAQTDGEQVRFVTNITTPQAGQGWGDSTQFNSFAKVLATTAEVMARIYIETLCETFGLPPVERASDGSFTVYFPESKETKT